MANVLSSGHNVINTLISGLRDWGTFHPITVHIPVSLFLTAPLFILIGLMARESRKAFFLCALILMLAGTAGIFLSVSTGERASDLIEPNPAAVKTLEAHVRLAEASRLGFSILTILFALNYFLVIRPGGQSVPAVPRRILSGAFLIAYACALVLLFDAAHHGGKLVHYHRITSKIFDDPSR